MLKQNQIITGEITQMDESGMGILRVQKDIVYVRHVMLKEKVKIRIIKRLAKGYAGEILEILSPSKDRVKVNCSIYDRCGSCQLLHMGLRGQKEYKVRYLENLCKHAKNISIKVKDVGMAKNPYHYRNKMIIGFTKDRQHQIKAGFYEEYSHNIIPYKTCLLHPVICDEIIQTIISLMKTYRIEPYEEDKRKGLLRHVLIRYGAVSKQIMVVLVLNNQVFPARKNFVQALIHQHPEITTIVQNINTRKTSVVLGDEERVLYGKGYIEDTLCGLTFRISASSFYQINHDQTEILYKTALDLLKLTGNETILDAYCGIGTIGMVISKQAKQVIGVEINKDAVKDAKNNAARNQIRNIRFICDDAANYMNTCAQRHEQLDVIIMDPPRSGSSEAFIRSAVNVKPKQILYISCNPQTQIRDLQLFQKYGYTCKEMIGVDMFPGTFHVETIVLLSR